VLRYIALNPVEAGLVSRAEDWPWSSYGATLGLAPAPPQLALERIWRAFDTSDPTVGRERLNAFVDAGMSPDDMKGRLLLGGVGLAKRVDPLLEPHRDNPEFVLAERFAARPPLASVLEPAVGLEAIEDASRVAFFSHAYTLREIALATGVRPATVWSRIQRSATRRPHALTTSAGASLDQKIEI
jgi:hypothetical protein